ncbi:PKD domain-containing protein [Alteromonas sp. a30]|uniref:PKD domain-containing protein n=1 Tax=Alteromonas sp. a30 TaxID=2730917 RepID=UPI00227F0BC0|nr:PKD domain-containing protein [Alteromonas sp. a30]MCY7297082.1 hypothetical protein [Alteromonas sp. a30]
MRYKKRKPVALIASGIVLTAVVVSSSTAFATGFTPVPIDLRQWQVENYINTRSSWSLNNTGTFVTQTSNTNPSVFYSDFPIRGADITGTIRVNSSSDDDFIGFAIGYKKGDLTNPNADFLLLDWKRSDQRLSGGCLPSGVGLRGLALSRVIGIPQLREYWAHQNYNTSCTDLNNGVIQLVRAKNLGRTGWARKRTYAFRFQYTESNLKVYVNNNLEIDIDGEFETGSIAFYNYSQGGVTYGGYTINNVFANAGDDIQVEGSEEVELDGTGSGPNEVTYAWRQVSGTPVTLIGATTAKPTFIAPEVTDMEHDLVFELVASINGEPSEPDTINVKVTDTVAPSYLARSVNFDAETFSIDGAIAMSEPTILDIAVSNFDDKSLLDASQIDTLYSEPFSTEYALSLDKNTAEPVIRVDFSAQDQIGNRAPNDALLLFTGISSSNTIEPITGVGISFEGEMAELATGTEAGRPLVNVSNDDDGELVFRLTPEQAQSLCGVGNNCLIYGENGPIETTVMVLPDGTVEFRANIDPGQRTPYQLGFDPDIGGAGVNSATDPTTGTVFTVGNGETDTGIVVQTLYSSDGTATVTAGEDGGTTVISFTLTPEQDLEKCAARAGVCFIEENFSTELSSQRSILADGKVRYSAVVTLLPNEVNLYTLKTRDSEPPNVGPITIDIPVLKGGTTGQFRVGISDSSGVIGVVCRFTLPDGSVVEVNAMQNASGVWEWEYTPSISTPSGSIQMEIIATDAVGNVASVFPIDATTGQPASFILDNDIPEIVIPENPIIAPTIVDGFPVADRGQCVQLNVLATDPTTAVESLVFIVTQPNGVQTEVSGQALGNGAYVGEYCVTVSSAGGIHTVDIEALDSVGNLTFINCEHFFVNSPPIVDAGPDIFVSPNEDANFDGSFTDPDTNDTHNIKWSMGNGDMRFEDLMPPYSYLNYGTYTATLTVTDSFGAVGSDQRIIYVLGSGAYGDLRGLGFWKQQFAPKGNGKGNGSKKVEDEELQHLLSIIKVVSDIFDETLILDNLEDATQYIDLKKASLRERAVQHTLVAWLNMAYGAIKLQDLVDFDNDGVKDLSFAQAMTAIEAILLDENASKSQLELAKDAAENLIN